MIQAVSLQPDGCKQPLAFYVEKVSSCSCMKDNPSFPLVICSQLVLIMSKLVEYLRKKPYHTNKQYVNLASWNHLASKKPSSD